MKHIKTKTFKQIYLIGILVLVLGFCFAASMDSMVILAADLILCVALMVFFIVFYRCPYCGKFLGKNNGAFCQFCGKKLDND